jgi:hypothetical protein
VDAHFLKTKTITNAPGFASRAISPIVNFSFKATEMNNVQDTFLLGFPSWKLGIGFGKPRNTLM